MSISFTHILNGVNLVAPTAAKFTQRVMKDAFGHINNVIRSSYSNQSNIGSMPRAKLAANQQALTELSPRDRVINTKSADWKKGSEVWTGVGARNVS